MWPTELSIYFQQQDAQGGPEACLLVALQTVPSLLLTCWASRLGTLHLPTKIRAVPEEREEEGVLCQGRYSAQLTRRIQQSHLSLTQILTGKSYPGLQCWGVSGSRYSPSISEGPHPVT